MSLGYEKNGMGDEVKLNRLNACVKRLSIYVLMVILMILSQTLDTKIVCAQAKDQNLESSKLPEGVSVQEYEAIMKSFQSSTPTTAKPTNANAPSIINLSTQPYTQPTVPSIQRSSQNNPSLINTSLILDVATAYFDHDRNTSLGAHDPNTTGFNLQQLELHMQSNVDPYLSMQTNIVFSQFGVEVEEAYANTTNLPMALKLKAGQFLTAFGRLNPTHPHQWHFLDQPWVNGLFFGGEGSRGLGSELSILMPLPWYVEVLSSLTEAKNACCARSFLGSQSLPTRNVGDLLVTSAIKQFFDLSSSMGFFWGLSAQFGPNPTGQNNRTEIYGTDIYLRYRPVQSVERRSLSLHGEWMYRRQQRPGSVLVDQGGHLSLIAQIFLRWETAIRLEKIIGQSDPLLDPTWGRPEDRYSFQLTFFPTHFSRVRLQLQHMQTSQMPSGFGIMLGLETMIGTHGAHDY
jgi:hypothetical protein